MCFMPHLFISFYHPFNVHHDEVETRKAIRTYETNNTTTGDTCREGSAEPYLIFGNVYVLQCSFLRSYLCSVVCLLDVFRMLVSMVLENWVWICLWYIFTIIYNLLNFVSLYTRAAFVDGDTRNYRVNHRLLCTPDK